MTVAKKLKEHLAGTGVDYEVVKHPRTYSSSTTAQAAHVSGEHLAKSVVLHDEEGYLLAVVPSTHRVELHTIHDLTPESPLLLSSTPSERFATFRYSHWLHVDGEIWVYAETARPNRSNEIRLFRLPL